MNSEHLDLYRQLSETKVYRERMGALREGDIASFDKSGPELITISLQNDFEDSDTFPDWIAKWKWLPPVFDPENPERCLWGMVDWVRWEIDQSTEGLIYLEDTWIPPTDVVWGRLDIALIKAILKQEEAQHGSES
jgi:hypothetical protein